MGCCAQTTGDQMLRSGRRRRCVAAAIVYEAERRGRVRSGDEYAWAAGEGHEDDRNSLT